MHPVSQTEDAAQLQQEFIEELYLSGNQFGLLHELRAPVLRDGFRLQTRELQPRNLPYTSLARLFKGREHIMAELHERLLQAATAGPSTWSARREDLAAAKRGLDKEGSSNGESFHR